LTSQSPKRVGAVAAADFLRLIGRLALALGAPGRRLIERPLRGRRQRRCFARRIRNTFACGPWLRPIGIAWHRL